MQGCVYELVICFQGIVLTGLNLIVSSYHNALKCDVFLLDFVEPQ